jgi:SAM-dependent methyltransferase
MSATDHFSGHAQDYARHRPRYPAELFAWLASQCCEHALAWDCGTGNGQAALDLTPHFSAIHATDLSAEQLSHATPHPKICYHAAPAEESGLPARSVDLVTVAQALHWFRHDAFYAEVIRVLKPGGVFAAWTYRLLDAEPAINDCIAHFHGHTVGPWWPPERRWVDEGYRTLPFPFDEIASPMFVIERAWTLVQLLDYLRTWSATQRYLKERGSDPTLELAQQLAPLWGDPEQEKVVRWPLALRCGRVQS